MYIVLDLFYTPDEGQECFNGTFEECEIFIKEQIKYSPFSFGMYKIVQR